MAARRTTKEDATLLGVGRRVCEVREERGMTQEGLAERIPMEIRNLRRIELGTQNVTVRTLAKIARALDCDLIEFFRPVVLTKRSRGRPPKKTT